MPIQSGDIKLIASKVMDDVPNGGGGPSAVVIQDGDSNSIFSDVTERQRAIGGVSIRQLHGAVQTGDTSAYMDPTIVLSQLPNDPNVSITLAKTTMFARRTDIANTIENYLIASSEWGGYLLENHVAGQRSIQLFQRPGMPPPTVGRTLVLVQNEGLPAQVMQYVRVTKVTTTQRTFTYSGGGTPVDYVADVLDCDLTDVLRSNFAGSPPNRFYVRDASKAVVRDTTVANAATFYGASPLTAVGNLGDSVLRVSSVYTQLVPSARTESAALDQKPAAQRVLTLAESPRRIDVGVTPHTMRIRVGQENRSFAWVQMLKPLPARGTIVISYMALGNWYTLMDDGSGAFTGAGVGTVNYQTGSLSITLPSIPDAGTSIIIQWGENTAYTSRAGQAGFRAPEFAWTLPQAPVKPGSVVVTWMSGGVLKTATDNGNGGFTGHATGEINYATGQIFLRPSAMIDAGGQFSTAYVFSTQMTEQFTSVAPDAGGFATIALAQVPVPRSITARWVTVRNVSASSGSTEVVSNTKTDSTTTNVSGPGTGAGGYYLHANGRDTSIVPPGQGINCKFGVPGSAYAGTYVWQLVGIYNGAAEHLTDPASLSSVVAGGVPSGQFTASTIGDTPEQQATFGRFAFPLIGAAPLTQFDLCIRNSGDTVVFERQFLLARADEPPVSTVYPQPAPADTLRDTSGVYAVEGMRQGGVREDTGAVVSVTCQPLYDAVFGWCYDPPAYGGAGQKWTAAELAAGTKTMTSERGVATAYTRW